MKKANGLAGQTSPYLLQHAHNPVNWQPWGEPALETARREDKPIFLSIGYAACHWCHVMERESFEDESIAAYINEHFVSIKVDREERPDIDAIYMNAVQLLTGAGGWPLTAFLAPDLQPFAGGTYFPPENRYGRIGFKSLLERVVAAWENDRDRVMAAGSELTSRLQRIADADHGTGDHEATGREQVDRAVAEMKARFDEQHGGFGAAPKFPPDTGLALLLRRAEHGDSACRHIAERTLEAMARGGIYDHVGGGFSRYSVDERWLVPHFEKMLYNQALLVPVYADAVRLTGRAEFRRVAEQTLDFVRRELTDPAGGFWSSLDADSEGVEGRFYVWGPGEIEKILGADARLFCEVYGITSEGNFEGRSIPNLLHGGLAGQASTHGMDERGLVDRLRPLHERLLAAREERVRPATDDKVLTGWNGLMITAFARAHQVLSRDEDLKAARRAATFALDQLFVDGRLKATWRNGSASLNGYLDDYAFLGRAFLDLYETDFERRWLDRSTDLARAMIDHFHDDERGGFFFTSDDHEVLIARNRSTHDGALPSGAGVAAGWLLRLAAHVDDKRFETAGRGTLVALKAAVDHAPSAFAGLLTVVDWDERTAVEVAVAGAPSDPSTRQLVRCVREKLPAWTTLAAGTGKDVEGLPLFDGRSASGSGARAYVCRDRTCRPPVSDPESLVRELEWAEAGQ